MLDSESIKTMIRPLLIFVVLMVGITAILQKTLIIYKLAGPYTHWAVIILLLPVMLGMLLRRMQTEQALAVVIAGSLLATICLYFLYKTYFWAQSPTFLNSLFLFAVMAGGAHMPYARGPIENLVNRLQAIFKGQKKARAKQGKTTRVQKQPGILSAIFAHENTIPLIEMSVGIISLLLSVYSIAFMGKG